MATWWWRPEVPLLVLFAVSRAAYRLAGVSFDPRALSYGNQLLDATLLEHDLGRSTWFLHMQPPLLNVLAGLVLKLPDRLERPTFAAAFLALGVVLTLALYHLMAGLCVPRWAALLGTAAFTLGPPTVLYENYLFYTYPVAVMLCASAACLLQLARTGRTVYAVAFLGLLAALVLLRSTFHPVWLVASGALVFVGLPHLRRRLLLAAVVPLAVVLGWYGKNLLLFDSFSGSSWLGMNLDKVLVASRTADELERLIADGEVSELARLGGFGGVDAYVPEYVEAEHRGVPALDRADKVEQDTYYWIPDLGPVHNFNNIVYVDVSRQLLADAGGYFRRHPREYGQAFTTSLRFAFLPASDYPFLEENRREVEGIDRAYNRLLGQPERYFTFLPRGASGTNTVAPDAAHLALAVVAAYGLAIAAAPLLAWRLRRSDPASAVVLAFLALTVAYVTVVANGLELGENNRFRFETDPLALAAAAAVIATLGRSVRARLLGAAPARSSS